MKLNVIYDEDKYQEILAARIAQINKAYNINLVCQVASVILAGIFGLLIYSTGNNIFGWLEILPITAIAYSLLIGFGKKPGEDSIFEFMKSLNEWATSYTNTQNSGFFAKTEKGKWLCKYYSLMDEYNALDWALQYSFGYEGLIPDQFETLTLEMKENGTVEVKFQ